MATCLSIKRNQILKTDLLYNFLFGLCSSNNFLIKVDDYNLLNFIRGCKWSTERAKEKIDYFYSARTELPDIFDKRDPFSPDIQNLLQAGILNPLPNKKDHDSPKIIFCKFSELDAEKIPCVTLVKAAFMLIDVLLQEDDSLALSGIQIIADYKGIPINYMAQITPKIIKSFFVCVSKAYPARFKNFTGINVPEIVEKLLNTLVNAVLKEKIRKRINFYSSNVIDKSLLPTEIGGQNGSILEISEQWKTKIESYRDWFLEDAKYRSDETLRIGKPKYINEEFGMDGTFRKLTFD